MPNISVFVNEDLKDRMDREEGEDWSKVAALAFEKRLSQLIRNRTMSDREAEIQRLRAARNEYDETINAKGYEAGKRWAESSASFAQLKRLCEFTDQLESEPLYRWGDFLDEDNDRVYTASVILACHIEGQDPDRDLSRDFWRSATASVDTPEPDFTRAFATGATEIYHAVADKLAPSGATYQVFQGQ